jgi:hypothetical protein
MQRIRQGSTGSYRRPATDAGCAAGADARLPTASNSSVDEARQYTRPVPGGCSSAAASERYSAQSVPQIEAIRLK